ncbi:MAG: ArsR family transcriptional regulator [Promethearchaeota archaeon]
MLQKGQKKYQDKKNTEQKILKKTSLSEFSHNEEISTTEILKNKTRFMIHSLLSIYPELSLKHMADLLGKSKSAVFNHIKFMTNAGIVEKCREEEVRSDKNRYLYSLTQDSDEKTKYVGKHCPADKNQMDNLKEKSDVDKFIEKIETFMSFNQNKIKIMKYWQEYLEDTKNQIIQNSHNQEQVQKIMDSFKNMQKERQIFTSVSYYSSALTKEVSQKYYDIYNEMEDLASLEAKKSPRRIRPNYASMTIIPILEVLEFMQEQQKLKKEKAHKSKN